MVPVDESGGMKKLQKKKSKRREHKLVMFKVPFYARVLVSYWNGRFSALFYVDTRGELA